ncbi:SpoIIE family protein phosphatase [Streptomyces olivochromogenes]|uniref:SpoIIE family protein phosphatase n=1 Tax=Streptomyces olivochromogenes TaxID=1963 RepID=UPI001F453CE7|nr:SpoIIE family protein phosphatase [Streptomyces olivochromogenes]MCF3130680.1 SpoIIE family protein phosphatase [Streptomyces olivochromogenes]
MGVSRALGSTEPADPFDIESAAVAVTDARGLIVFWSPGAERLLGHPARDVVGRPAETVLAGGDLGAAVAGLRRSGRAWHGVLAVLHRAGHTLDLALRACPLAAADGHRGWLVVACDAEQRIAYDSYETLARGLLERSPLGIAVLGTEDLRWSWANRALTEMEGHRQAGGDGTGTDAGSGEVSPLLQRHARRALVTGQPQVSLEYAPIHGADRRRRGQRRVSVRSFFPVRNSEGETLGICLVALQAVGQDSARDRLALLNEAGEHIGTTLDLGRTVQELAEVMVPRVADFVAIDVLEGVRARADPSRGTQNGESTLRRAGHLSIQEDLPEVVVEIGGAINYPPPSPQQRCLGTGRSIREDVSAATPWLLDDSERWTKLIRLGVHSHLVVPLRARGITMGVVTLLRWKNPDAFDEDDLLLVEELVARAGVCVDNARRFAREREAALMLQKSLLPPDLPRHHAVEVACRYLPTDVEAGVGGDWFDVIPLSGGRVALVVGDVIGHGLHAAASMGRLRAAVQTLADLDLPPDELMTHVDDLVVRLSEEAEAAPQGPTVVGATCVYAVYDPVARTVCVARAGHPSPAIAHLSEPVEFPDIPAGPPLGLGGLPFESKEIAVEEGSIIALYTDGLIEASDRDVDVGMERLCFTLAHPDRPLEEICDIMVRTLLPDRPRDDVAFLIARTHALSPDRVAAWDVPADPSAVHDTRTKVDQQLSVWGLDDVAFTAELVVSELVTNAIKHAFGPISLRLIHERNLICEVSDASSTSPHLRRALTTDEGGRGLFLVAQVAQRWGTRHSTDGKTIWAELQLPEEP